MAVEFLEELKMKKLLLVLLFSVFLTSFVLAQEICDEVGVVNSSSGEYCSVEGVWENLIVEGGDCLNNYECFNEECSEGICGSKYAPLIDRLTTLQEIQNFILGIECDPNDQSYSCDGRNASLCGANGVWEDKGEVPGECGVPADEDEEDPDNGNGGNVRCIPLWNCTSWSRNTCGVRSCIDIHDCGTNYRKPLQVKSCPSNSRCGDGTCDAGYEFCGINNVAPNCISDCGVCPINLDSCGNGKCDASESSATCPEDCPAEPRSKVGLVIFILVVMILLVLIGLVVYFLVRTIRENNMLG
jgi:hypothetical protein